MKLKVFTLIFITTMFVGVFASQPAEAQNRGARFTFAPNIYRKQTPRLPRSSFIPRQAPVHRVAHGHVPKNPSYLGVDSSFLKSTRAKTRPMTRSTTHVAFKSKQTKASFKKNFGKPAQLAAKSAKAKALPKKSIKKVSGKVRPKRRARKSVRAKRVRRHRAKPKVAKGYGNKFYTPGGHTPSSSTSRSSTSRQVRGEVLR